MITDRIGLHSVLLPLYIKINLIKSVSFVFLKALLTITHVTYDKINNRVILLTNKSDSRSTDFVNHSYDYRLNWTPISPITIINQVTLLSHRRKNSLIHCGYLTADLHDSVI